MRGGNCNWCTLKKRSCLVASRRNCLENFEDTLSGMALFLSVDIFLPSTDVRAQFLVANLQELRLDNHCRIECYQRPSDWHYDGKAVPWDINLELVSHTPCLINK